MDNMLFDPSVLSQLDFSHAELRYNPKIDFLNPGKGLVIRPLKYTDYDLGFPDILTELTTLGEVSRELFEETFKNMKNRNGMYYIVVIEDKNINRVVGTGTLLLEQKFIHNCALRGRVEDLVVYSSHRGQQLGKLLIDILVTLSKHLGCYKITLDCTDEKRGFYETLGLQREKGNSNFMQIRF